MADSPAYTLADRELSWLAFNDRVLQEAEDLSVPVGDRVDFLAIVSSNLDEFFRVRVAGIRSLLRLGRKKKARLPFDPAELLGRIHVAVHAQQERFGRTLREGVLPALREHGIELIDERSLDDAQITWLATFFEQRVQPRISIAFIRRDGPVPFLENGTLYLVVTLGRTDGPRFGEASPDIALVPIPAALPRFVQLPEKAGIRPVMFLDDVVRLHLPVLFGDAVAGAWSVKLTRDAELPLRDEFSDDVVKAMRKALKKRADGVPSRFLYDPALPSDLLRRLEARLALEPEDLIAGGRYHHLHDLFSFPRFDLDLSSPPLPPMPGLAVDSVIEAVAERDRMLHFPYHAFDPVVRFLDEAAVDPAVESIRITLYRVARNSSVVDALENAARRGRQVTAFVELKARFDEQSNIDCGERLEAAGAQVLYSMPRLKVHSKLALVERREGAALRRYAWLGTGNFNERTARVYADHGLFTADPAVTSEVRQVFDFLSDPEGETPDLEHLLVAPFALRHRLRSLVHAEIEAAAAGKPAGITLKLNSLEDPEAIGWLYDAGEAGVPVDLIVRGICRLVPEAGRNIRARSIVDRFLEHARVYRFLAGGEDLVYLASADWMTRNLDRRVEVAFPVRDPALKHEIVRFLEIQLADNVKARRIDGGMTNAYTGGDGPRIRAQVETCERIRTGWGSGEFEGPG